jgi:hypothetical protein
VYCPKWKDFTKTISDKTGKHTGAPSCLRLLVNGKEMVKPLKAGPPAKINNKLLAEAATLKFNIAIGDPSVKKTETDGFGDLVYKFQLGDPSGLGSGTWTVSQISDSLDRYLGCTGNTLNGDSAQWYAVARRINGAFSGVFDTLSFATVQGSKTEGGTRASGVKAIADVDFLYRTSSQASPVNLRPLDSLALEAVPERSELAQNYPNPFNPTTTIEFSLPDESFVTMKVYNMLGQEVVTLVENEQFDEGTNEVTFDASSMSSGVYYYRITVNGSQYHEVKKMLLMK